MQPANMWRKHGMNALLARQRANQRRQQRQRNRRRQRCEHQRKSVAWRSRRNSAALNGGHRGVSINRWRQQQQRQGSGALAGS
jgi:hypothetical protein